ncbi:MAG TPA: peptide ABC transporter substrate-binding protein [Sphingomonadales bacterium]
MTFSMRTPLKAAVLGVIALCITLAGAANAASVLRRGTASEPPSIDPHLAAGDSSSVIIDDLFVGLMTSGPKGELVYGVAESHELGEDGVTYTFKLRPGLKWSDGAKLDSSDVVYSFRRLMNPATAARYAGNFYMIRNAAEVNTGKLPVEELGVRAVDPLTVEIVLERPTPYFLEILRSNAAVVVPRHAIEAHDKAWTRAGRMVSNGAYRLVEWLPNTLLKMERNQHYWKADQVKIDSVIYYPASDLGTMLKRYQAGELDVIFNFPPEQIEAVRANLSKDLRVVPDYGLFYWLMNGKTAPFNDPRVRKALAISIDKEAITKRLLKDTVEPAWGVVPTGFSEYESQVTDYDRIPLKERQAEARKLLEAAGYGPRKPLEFEIRFDSREEPRQIAVAMASMWSAIGVKAKMRTSDFRSLTADVARGNFQMARYQWFAPFQDPATFVNLLRGDSRTNHSGYDNPKVDEILQAADAQTDQAKRMKLMAEAEKLAMADHPIIPIYYPVARRLIKQRVEGWANFPGGKVKSEYLSLR